MSDERIIPTQGEKTTDLPTMSILVEGTEISAEYQVASVAITRGTNQISAARIVLLDGDSSKEKFEISDKTEFTPGKKVEVKAGYHSEEETVFKGIIVKHGVKVPRGGPSVLTLDLRDEAVKLTVGRKNAYFYDKKDSEIIEEIVGTYSGLSKDVEATPVKHKEMVQYYATDWDFITTRAEASNAVIFTEDGKVVVKKPTVSGDAVLKLIHGATLYEFEAEMDSRKQYKSVKSASWDPSAQELLEMTAATPSLTEGGNLKGDELADVIGLSDFETRHSGRVEDAELQAWADSLLNRSRLSKIRGRAKCQGFGAIKPGDVLELEGVGERFSGKVFVAGVRQTINTQNWETDLEFGLDDKWFMNRYHDVVEHQAAALLPGVQGLHVGVVVKIHEDPDSEERVQVRMPLVDKGEDGVWARVATLDAGKERGSFFRPEVGDEVVLGFMNDDPRDPVILGMMHSSKNVAPLTAEEKNPQKGFVTREKLKLLFDDEKKIITIETPGGNSIILDEDAGSITITDQNQNTVEMTDGGFAFKTNKDFKVEATGDVKIKGTNVEVEASAGFKAKGATTEVNGSGQTTIKGGMVMIN